MSIVNYQISLTSLDADIFMNLGGGTGKLRTPGGAAVGDGGAAVASSGGVSWRKKCLKV